MSAQPGDQHWFISLKGKRYGPFSFAALSEAVAKGVIDGNTSVWRLGWVKWHTARRVPGLIEEMPPPEPLDQGEDGEIDQGVDRAPEAGRGCRRRGAASTGSTAAGRRAGGRTQAPTASRGRCRRTTATTKVAYGGRRAGRR